ncbi:MAG: EAL domain-containing protein [Hyphomicrobium sp.]
MRFLFSLFAFLGGAILQQNSAMALKAINISPDIGRLEITPLGELYEGRGDSLQIETASTVEGTSGRLSVRASSPGSNPSWMVFALHNPSDTTVERWISSDRYTIIGSGIIWPDLDTHRIEAVTPSMGFVPERIKNERADLFRITLEPGQTITYIAELSSDRYARIYLWKSLDYELNVRDRQLFNGIMLGLTGLLAVFLTAIFAANHKIIFPAASLVAWSVLGYLCVDFGFFHKLFQLKVENNSIYRAATESAIPASLVFFLGLFLRAPLWNRAARMLFSVWLITQVSFIFLALVDPRLASTFARLSFAFLGALGFLITSFFAARGQDRAISLIPTWLFLLVWIFGAGLTLAGHLSGDMVVSALVAGLVLIVLLIGFTVTQFAFRSQQPLYGSSPSELQFKSIAVDGAGAGVWEWNSRQDKIRVSENVEGALGLNVGELNTNLQDFCRYVHPSDLERFKLSLEGSEERNGGHMRCAFRLRKADNSYRWYEVDSSPILNSDGRTFKSVGLMRDVTDSRRSQERLLQDAVKCSLTGLPNRQLLIDRLQNIMRRAKSEPLLRPTMVVIDLDRFKSVNISYGLALGDSLLLAVTRRLQKYVEEDDTLARISGDRFALLLVKERSAAELAGLAENVRRSLRSPMTLAGQEVLLTSSVGIAVYDPLNAEDQDMLGEAEAAVFRAKRAGLDSVEIYRPEKNHLQDDHTQIWNELQKSVEKSHLKLLYRPIVYLPMEELAGFETIVRWEHPKYGLINPFAYLQEKGHRDLFSQTLRLALARSLKHCNHWHKELPRSERPLFVSLNLPEGVQLGEDIANEVRRALSHPTSAKSCLKIGIAESLIMENPEQSIEILGNLQSYGAEIILDGFGMGYSSLLYLERLPIKKVRASLQIIGNGSFSKSASGGMLRAVTAMAHELGLKVLIDGLETNEDVSFMRSISCEYGQGFYYGDYLSQREILKFIRQIRKAEQRMQSRGLFSKSSAKKASTRSRLSPSSQSETEALENFHDSSLQNTRAHSSDLENKKSYSVSSVSEISEKVVGLMSTKEVSETSFNATESSQSAFAVSEQTIHDDIRNGAFVNQSFEENSSIPVVQLKESPSTNALSSGYLDDTYLPAASGDVLVADIAELSTEPANVSVSIVMGGEIEPPALPPNSSDYSEAVGALKSTSAELNSALRMVKKPDPLENIPNYEKLPPRIAESLRKLAG